MDKKKIKKEMPVQNWMYHAGILPGKVLGRLNYPFFTRFSMGFFRGVHNSGGRRN